MGSTPKSIKRATRSGGLTKRRRSGYDYSRDGVSESPLDRILELLNDAALQKSGTSWIAQCPAHTDVNPSLSISEGDGGKVLLYCHTGCEFDEILDAMGIDSKDLFPNDYASVSTYSRNGHGRDERSIESTPPKRNATKRRRRRDSHDNEKPDWKKLASRYERCVDSISHISKLAGQLGLHMGDLRALGAGWKKTQSGGVYTFPERDAEGNVIGIATRTIEGAKRFLTGGNRGLYLPIGWKDRSGEILIAEGASDTAALTGMETAAIGRPSATGGVSMLADLLSEIPRRRDIVVLGEYDMKPDGRWPGLDGAKRVAAGLADRLGRRVRWALPPDHAKDVREWFQRHRHECEDATGLRQLGRRFHDEVWAQSEPVEPSLSNRRDEFIDSKTFLQTEYSRTWLIRGLLVEGQPAIVGGAKKSMKTSLLIDLAVSIAEEEPFLGRFGSASSTTVGFICAESGEATVQETLRRVAESKGIRDPEWLRIYWKFRMPRLSVAEDLERLADEIERHRLEVVIIDPVYLGLLAGNSDVQASNLMHMGPLLADLSSVCLDLGATPILAHHTRMHAGSYQSPPDLEDLSFAGFQEFARQWLLVGRREKYEPGSGHHKLWLNAGGSAGQSSCWAVNIDEGRLRDDFSGRTWKVAVHSAQEERQVVMDRRQRDQEEQRQTQLEADQQAIIEILNRNPEGETKTAIRTDAEISGERVTKALRDLIDTGEVESAQVEKPAGRGHRKYDGFRLRESDE